MGGKKGGGSSHTPREAKETGRSYQIMRMLEVISEGEIYGLVDDMCSIYLDNTPLQNKDGTFNFQNVSVYANSGTQDQDVLKEFNSVEKEIELGIKILKDKPLLRTVTDTNVTRVRMTLGVERLMVSKDNGDIEPTLVAMRITVTKDNRAYSTRDYTFNGKYSSAYREMFYIDVPTAPFSIKVERVTDDSNSTKISNNTFWSSYTEIIDQQFAYPNTALVGMKIDSEYFSSEPTRNYELYGLMVKVPANYNPFDHTYTSDIWNGEFKVEWTNNPAWIFYDIVTNDRYGMGQRLADFGIDKWQLYSIGRYCDELVPDGFGGNEPRMTCNIWITDQRKAYELLNDLTSVFRAMPIWNGQALTAIQDRASDPVWTFNNANVIGGFTRQRSSMKARHNTIQVEYVDAEDSYEKKVESVSNDQMVARYGQNIKKVTAFGCTSRGQAYRTGRWILETERLETETISFTVGQEGLQILPYDVFEVADSEYAGLNIGGRIVSSNGTKVVLDREIEIDDGSYLSYVSNNAITENVKIVSYDNANRTVTLAKSVGILPEQTVWGLSTKRISKGLYRAISIKENDNGDSKTYSITGLQHVPEKENIVINGTHFDPKPQTIYGEAINAEIEYNGQTLSVKGVVNGNFNVLSSNTVSHYTVKLLKDGALVYIEKNLKTPEIKLDDLENGNYEAVIYSYNERNQLLKQYSKTFKIDKPPIVQNIEIYGHLSSIILTWNMVDDTTETEIWASEQDDISTAKLVERIIGGYYSHSVGAKQIRYYWLRHKRGVNIGNFDQIQGRKGESSIDLDNELEVLSQELNKNIVDEIINVALPARKLGMTLYVENLTDFNTYLGQNTVYDETANKQYTWNGTTYIPTEVELIASSIKGIIQPNQIATIPTTKLSGSINANMLTGTIPVNRLPTVPTSKLGGTISDAQLSAVSASKITGIIDLSKVPTIPTTKLSGSISDSMLQSVSANKISGTISATNLAPIPTSKLTGKISANQLAVNSVGANAIQAGVIGATHIATNSIGANHLQANSIGTNHLGANVITSDKIGANQINARNIATNAIEATHIKANAIGANAIQAGAIGADKLAVNSVTATKIQANSIGTNHIAVNSLNGDRLLANTIEGGKIKAGAIATNHLQAGAISADKLAIGLGGNLLQNPIFANIENNAPSGWQWWTNGIATATANTDRNYGLRSYALPTENCMRIVRTNRSTTNYAELTQVVPVNRGMWYIASVYMGNHRSVKCELIVQYLNSSGYAISETHKAGGNNFSGLETAERVFIKFQTPANCEAVKIYLRQTGITGRNTNATMLVARPMLEECTQHATQPSAWVNAGVTSIHGGSIVTNSVTAQQIKARTITTNEIAVGTITANNIAVRTITADKIVTHSLTSNEIRGKSINADRLNVNNLAAISANLGTVTAGTITGTTITGNTITGGTINGTEISGGIIKGSRFIGATGDFSGTIQVSSSLGDEVGSYSQQTNFRLIDFREHDKRSCYQEGNNANYEVCTGPHYYTSTWRSTNTFTINSSPEETILLPPNIGYVKSISPKANGLLGSTGVVIKSDTVYTVVVEIEKFQSDDYAYVARQAPPTQTITLKRHKRF